MPRPTWEGQLRLSLVTCPVALYSATTRTNDVSFHLLHKKTHHRVRMVPHDPELGPVERSDLVRGYEIKPDQYVIVTNAEINAVRLPSTKTIDIEEFVDVSEIDHIYWNDPYFLTPSEKNASPAYAVIREAMEESGKIALGRVVMHTRERLVAIEPRGRGMLLTTLRSFDEVRDEAEYFSHIPAAKPDRQMLEIAEKIIDQQAAEFDPSQFKDRYEEALRKVIKQKEKGKPITEEARPRDEKVIDLMDALKRSLGGKGGEKPHAQHVLKRHTQNARAPKRRKKAS